MSNEGNGPAGDIQEVPEVVEIAAPRVLEGDDLRKALLSALARAHEDGSLQQILRDVLQAPKPQNEAIRAAGVGIDDLLADFESPRDPSSDAAEISFDLSTSPSNEESGGFFISTGGGGLNLPLDDDEERCQAENADEEDLTEATRRVYLSRDSAPVAEAPAAEAAEAAPAEAAAAPVAAAPAAALDASAATQTSSGTTLTDSLEVSGSLGEPPMAPPEEAELADSTLALSASTLQSTIKVSDISEPEKKQMQDHEEMLIRLHDRLLAKQSVMQCVLKGLLNVQAREMRLLKEQVLAEEPKNARVEEAPLEGLDEQAAETGRRHGRGSKNLAAKKRRTLPGTSIRTTTTSVIPGAKASPRPGQKEGGAVGSGKRRSSKGNVDRPAQSPEGVENSSRPSSRASARSDREEEPEQEATDTGEANAGLMEGQEGNEAATAQEEPVAEDPGIGVCEVSEAEFQLLFDAGVLYQACGFYPPQPVGFFNIPSFGEQLEVAAEQAMQLAQQPAQQAPAAAPETAQQEWYQQNAVDPMYYQQYQYQQALQAQMQQAQALQAAQAAQQAQAAQAQGAANQPGVAYQYPYYQQPQYAQYGNSAPQQYGAPPPMYQQTATARPPSQQAQAPGASGANGQGTRHRPNAGSKENESPVGSEVASEAEAEGDKEAESPKDGAKNLKGRPAAKGKAAAKRKIRKKPVEPPVDKGPKCQLFFLPLDTLQHWKKDPEMQKDEHHEEHGSMSGGSQGSQHSDDGDWQAMTHHWSEAPHATDYDEPGLRNEEDSLENPTGDAAAGSALNSARALKQARTMPERTPDQSDFQVRPPGGKAPKTRRPQPNVVFTGDN